MPEAVLLTEPVVPSPTPDADATLTETPTPEITTPGPLADWTTNVPADVRQDKTWQAANFKDVASLAKSWREQQKMIGASVRPPAEDAPAEEWDRYFSKLGRPESPDKYQLKPPAPLEQMFDEATSKAFRERAHKLGLTQKQAQELLDWYGNDRVGSAQEQINVQRKATETQLREEWGANYTKNLTLAQRAVQELGGEDAIKILNVSGLGNHPAIVRLMARVGAALAEDGLIVGEVAGTNTTEEAREKIASIMSDRNHAYHRRGPGHDEAVEQMTRLFQIAYPSI